jgi:DNA-binding MarR family transcriptional regulator
MPRQAKTEEIAGQLHSVAIHLLRLVRVQDARSGIAPARLSALSVIVFGGPISLRDLAKAEQVRPPTMSRIVDALESQGLAHRRVDKQDRRAVVIAATTKGVATLKEGRRRRVKFLASYLASLDREELAHVAQAVRTIQKALRS